MTAAQQLFPDGQRRGTKKAAGTPSRRPFGIFCRQASGRLDHPRAHSGEREADRGCSVDRSRIEGRERVIDGSISMQISVQPRMTLSAPASRAFSMISMTRLREASETWPAEFVEDDVMHYDATEMIRGHQRQAVARHALGVEAVFHRVAGGQQQRLFACLAFSASAVTSMMLMRGT